MTIVQEFSLAFIAIFVALDIVGTLPMYVSMTYGMKLPERRRIVDTSMFVALLVAFVFAIFGVKIFSYLGISVFDFRIAGGLVLLLVSLADLANGPEAVRQKPVSGSTGVVPLAVPLITGPGVLTQVILQVGTLGYVITLLALVLNYLIAWYLLRQSDSVTRLLGKDGTVVVSKIAALLLAAIAVSMIRGGVFDAISEFQTHHY